MKNKLLLCLLIITSSLCAQESAEDYCFSLRQLSYNYIGFPESQASQDVNYSMGWSGYVQFVQKTNNLQINGYTYKSTETYALDFSKEEVKSFKQIYVNILGAKGSFNDDIIFVTLPEYKNKWIEYNRQSKYDCSSEWAFVTYQKQGTDSEPIYEKAIKVTKSTTIKDGKKTTKVVEYTYWAKEERLLAKYGYFDDPSIVTLQELAVKVVPSSLKEISEKEYKTYLEEKAKKEEAERIARNEKIYEEFVNNLEPQSLEIVNSDAADRIRRYFTRIEIDRFKEKVLNGTTTLAEQSELNVVFQPKCRPQINAPAADIRLISSFISRLYDQNVFKKAIVTEPITQRTVEVNEFYKFITVATIKTSVFNVVKQKDTWRLEDKNALMPSDLEHYIKQAAQTAYDADHKKKKQTIELVSLRYEGNIVGVWRIENGVITSCVSSPSSNSSITR